MSRNVSFSKLIPGSKYQWLLQNVGKNSLESFECKYTHDLIILKSEIMISQQTFFPKDFFLWQIDHSIMRSWSQKITSLFFHLFIKGVAFSSTVSNGDFSIKKVKARDWKERSEARNETLLRQCLRVNT